MELTEEKIRSDQVQNSCLLILNTRTPFYQLFSPENKKVTMLILSTVPS